MWYCSHGSGPCWLSGLVKVAALVPAAIRQIPLAAVVHGSCTSPAPLAAGARHFPEPAETTVNVFVPVACRRNCWFVPEWQAYWMTVALSAVDAPKMSTQLPAVIVAMV